MMPNGVDPFLNNLSSVEGQNLSPVNELNGLEKSQTKKAFTENKIGNEQKADDKITPDLQSANPITNADRAEAEKKEDKDKQAYPAPDNKISKKLPEITGGSWTEAMNSVADVVVEAGVRAAEWGLEKAKESAKAGASKSKEDSKPYDAQKDIYHRAMASLQDPGEQQKWIGENGPMGSKIPLNDAIGRNNNEKDAVTAGNYSALKSPQKTGEEVTKQNIEPLEIEGQTEDKPTMSAASNTMSSIGKFLNEAAKVVSGNIREEAKKKYDEQSSTNSNTKQGQP